MGIRNLSSASISTGAKRSKFWDQTTAIGSYEPIATVYLSSGSATSIEFTSIPGTYKHLELRGIINQNSGGNSNGYFRLDVNGNVLGTYRHLLMGNGSNASSYSDSAGGNFIVTHMSGSNSTIFSAFILRIPDYSNSTTYKTLHAISGVGPGTYGQVMHSSTLYATDTSPITSLKLNNTNGDFRQYSHVALYGIKG